jgi:hypothetical protein
VAAEWQPGILVRSAVFDFPAWLAGRGDYLVAQGGDPADVDQVVKRNPDIAAPAGGDVLAERKQAAPGGLVEQGADRLVGIREVVAIHVEGQQVGQAVLGVGNGKGGGASEDSADLLVGQLAALVDVLFAGGLVVGL